MTKLYAQPFSDEIGFYFHSLEEYQERVKDLPIEEFEIRFIEGDNIDCALFEAIGVYQDNIDHFFEVVKNWNTDEKTRVIIAGRECGYNIDRDTKPESFDIDIYEVATLEELAYQCIDEGIFGEISENIRFYLDMDLITRELSMDYSETRIAGRNLVYRCG